MIKTLSRYIKGYIKPSILTPVFMIVEVIMEILIPFLMGNIVKYGIEKGDFDYVIKTGAIMVLCAGVSFAGGVLGGKFGAKASTGFAHNLGKVCITIFRPFLFLTLINSVQRDLLPDLQRMFPMCRWRTR